MHALLLLSLLAVAGADEPCMLGADDCGEGEVCIANPADGVCPEQGRCTGLPSSEEDVELLLPIPGGTTTFCAKGPLRTTGDTHAACWPATRHAIDLASPASEAPRLVLAPIGGVVYPRAGCASEDLSWSRGLDPCNDGFGNLVRIQAQDGRFVQLAHLSSVLVRWGQKVEAGDVLGVEGNSGNAGSKHIHLSVHVGDARLPGLGESVPFVLHSAEGRARSTELVCGDFSQEPKPDPRSALLSATRVGRAPATFSVPPPDPYAPLAAWALHSDPAVRRAAINRLSDDNTIFGRYWLAVALSASAQRRDLRRAQVRFRDLASEAEVPWVRTWSWVRTCLIYDALGRKRKARACATTLVARENALDTEQLAALARFLGP